ncbi:hypothetical protein [Vulcanisaeta distributa]|uniref:Uncharacterized protein n=1 Tax=Vulcanisaeta distributa (strain DSM 14429 / JCM 11212 / NBRC 100878 / IC-017) TaxID=572478 RepID=E1QNG3_VULDI|nr:hypothetical protein [Vulcanisaeta distributa]ADN50133.1 hypothetical protein Vdis_0740 [Vulcanisaeta distributa DSM 14429]
MAWNTRYTLALLIVIIALLVISMAIYLNPIMTNTGSILAQENTIQQQYLEPINTTASSILNYTRSLYHDIVNYLSAITMYLENIYYYQRINTTNIINAVNRSNTRIINKLATVNSSIIISINNVESNIESNVTSTINNAESTIYNAVINVSNYVANNNTEIINLLNKLMRHVAMYYQLYGAPYTYIQQSYTLFTFSNLTLVKVLLINVSVPSGGNVTVYCYTVPGTSISIPVCSTYATTAETININISNYPCWQIIIQAPGSTLNWYSGVLLYQG